MISLRYLAIGAFGMLIGVQAAVAADACPAVVLGGEPPQAGGPMICKAAYAMAPLLGGRIPAWSAEHLTAASVARAEAAKRTGDFHVEAALPEAERSTNGDYAGSGYDKGHMSPVGDFGDPIQEADTFSLGNMVPQRPELNRFLWQDIEAGVRHLAAAQGEAWVVTGPVVSPDAPKLKGRVAIPSETWKAVVTAKGIAGVYIATNVATPACRVLDLDAAIAEIGFDPLPGRPKAPAARPPPIPPRAGSAGCPSR